MTMMRAGFGFTSPQLVVIALWEHCPLRRVWRHPRRAAGLPRLIILFIAGQFAASEETFG